MTKSEEDWLKFTEEWRAEQDALDAIDKDQLPKPPRSQKKQKRKLSGRRKEKNKR